MEKIQLILEYQFWSDIFRALEGKAAHTKQILRENDKDFKALAIKEKLVHDRNIILPKLQDMQGEIIKAQKKEWGVDSFKFIEDEKSK